jgi:divalent metal cation (Fe/Co/Zn/Cd) transporter
VGLRPHIGDALHGHVGAHFVVAKTVGVGLAVVGGPAWKAADSWAALFACVVIVYNGIDVFSRGLGDVMDAAAPTEFENEVRAIAHAVPGVRALDKCRVRRSGMNHLVDIQVRVDGNLTVTAGHDIAHAVKDALLGSEPHRITDVSVHVEPLK